MAKPIVTPPTTKQLKLAKSAERKKKDGQKIPREETIAIARIEKYNLRKSFWDAMENVSQNDFCMMAGRQAVKLKKQASTYGFPWGRTIDLCDFVESVYDFFSVNGNAIYQALSKKNKDEQQVGEKDYLHEKRKIETDILQLSLDEKRKNLIPRDDVSVMFSIIGSAIKNAGIALSKKYGQDAADIIDEALAVIARKSEEMEGEADV